jgi:hypothetical protein
MLSLLRQHPFQFPHNHHPDLYDLTTCHSHCTFTAFLKFSCFLMVFKVDSGIPTALTLSTVHSLCSYLIIMYHLSSRIIDFLCFLPLVVLLLLLFMVGCCHFQVYGLHRIQKTTCYMTCYAVYNCRDTWDDWPHPSNCACICCSMSGDHACT